MACPVHDGPLTGTSHRRRGMATGSGLVAFPIPINLLSAAIRLIANSTTQCLCPSSEPSAGTWWRQGHIADRYRRVDLISGTGSIRPRVTYRGIRVSLSGRESGCKSEVGRRMTVPPGPSFGNGLWGPLHQTLGRMSILYLDLTGGSNPNSPRSVRETSSHIQRRRLR